ncbi:MAG: hypothetical protein VB106_04400 [Clostridiaceae bacterium]|nr:hypothetical protein [Clostridiaceae bacterium]
MPSLAVTVIDAAPLPLTFSTPVYFTFDPASKKVLISAAVPDRVSVPVPLPPMVTPPPELAVNVPADAVSVTVSASPSASLKAAADRSTLPG